MKYKLTSLVLALVLIGCGSEEPPKVAEAPKPAETQPAPAQPVRADYPDELIGKWATGTNKKACRVASKAEKDTGIWDGMTIQKDSSSGGFSSCYPTKVTNSGDSYIISEDCSGEGDEWKATTIYKISAETLKVTYDDGSGQKNDFAYTSCK